MLTRHQGLYLKLVLAAERSITSDTRLWKRMGGPVVDRNYVLYEAIVNKAGCVEELVHE